MPYYRLGHTESILLFIYWLEHIKNYRTEDITKLKKLMINWLYSTSGYYNKEIQGSYFDFDLESATNNDVYLTYMKKLYSLVERKVDLELKFDFKDTIEPEKMKEFLSLINNETRTREFLFNLIENKRVLFISSFTELIKKQIESGNLKKIYPPFKGVKEVICCQTIYTHLNNGPHNNILETTKDYISKLPTDYDIAVISFGAYSALIADHIDQQGKEFCILGGSIQDHFGILAKHNERFIKNKEYWLIVPESCRPPHYKKIEDGCYW